MDEVQKRLVKCFAAVFPDLSEDDIVFASQDSVSAWDSVSAIILLNVIEEEFGLAIDLEALPELNSFELILRYVRARIQN
jgi:acyl carrier protein